MNCNLCNAELQKSGSFWVSNNGFIACTVLTDDGQQQNHEPTEPLSAHFAGVIAEALHKTDPLYKKPQAPAVEPQKEYNIIRGQQKVSLAVDKPHDGKTHAIKGRQSPLNITGKTGSEIPPKQGINIEDEAGSTRPEPQKSACPDCGSSLRDETAHLRCDNCNARFSSDIKLGLHRLADDRTKFEFSTRPEMQPSLPRIETGNVQFDNDWPGVFFRGDTAINIARQLRLDTSDGKKVGFERLASLIDALEDCHVELDHAIQHVKRAASVQQEPLSAEPKTLAREIADNIACLFNGDLRYGKNIREIAENVLSSKSAAPRTQGRELTCEFDFGRYSYCREHSGGTTNDCPKCKERNSILHLAYSAGLEKEGLAQARTQPAPRDLRTMVVKILGNCANKYCHPGGYGRPEQTVLNEQIENAVKIAETFFAALPEATKEKSRSET